MSLDKSKDYQELSFISKIITNNINRIIKLDSEYTDLIKKLENKKLCEDDNCKSCYNNSFASYTGKTPCGKRKVDCWD